MRAVIISGGQMKDHDQMRIRIKPDDTVICADSGYDSALKMGLEPKIVIGDLDSIKGCPPEDIVIRYPAKKDLTDTELALYYARKLGFSEFLLLGCIGTRMDHSLSNIFLLRDILRRQEYGEIADEHNRIFITDSSLTLEAEKGSLFSFIPLTECLGVTTAGLEYPLNNATVQVGSGLGVSNICLESSVSITLSEGEALVMLTRD